MTSPDWILLVLAVIGLFDAHLERKTGRGIIARVQDWIEAKEE